MSNTHHIVRRIVTWRAKALRVPTDAQARQLWAAASADYLAATGRRHPQAAC